MDLVIDRVEQERWLDGATATDYDFADRFAAADRRPRVSSNLDALRAREDYPQLRSALLLYLVSVVPWPHETERRFWSITSTPSTNRSRTQRRLTAISMNNVEALVVAELLEAGEWATGGFVNVSPGMVARHPPLGWPVKRSRYRRVGEVDAIHFAGAEGLVGLLQRPEVGDAARRLPSG